MKTYRLMISCAASCVWLNALNGYALSDPAETLRQNNRAALDSWVGSRMESSSIHIVPKVVPIAEQSVREVFPKYDFYGVYMPRWPRAITPPEGLSYETIGVLCAGEFVGAIRGDEELKAFVAKNLTEVTSETGARRAAEAALILVSYCSSNGPFQLKEPVLSAVRESKGILVTAQAEVHEPARGDIKVTLEFDATGRTSPGAITIASAARAQPPPR